MGKNDIWTALAIVLELWGSAMTKLYPKQKIIAWLSMGLGIVIIVSVSIDLLSGSVDVKDLGISGWAVAFCFGLAGFTISRLTTKPPPLPPLSVMRDPKDIPTKIRILFDGTNTSEIERQNICSWCTVYSELRTVIMQTGENITHRFWCISLIFDQAINCREVLVRFPSNSNQRHQVIQRTYWNTVIHVPEDIPNGIVEIEVKS